MIIKSWKFKGFNGDFPDWVQENTGKRKGSNALWVYTQRGEIPIESGYWVSINLRGHVDIHNEEPENISLSGGNEILTGVLMVTTLLMVVVIMLAL